MNGKVATHAVMVSAKPALIAAKWVSSAKSAQIEPHLADTVGQRLSDAIRASATIHIVS
jgi:hypothetical protein